MSRDTAQGNRLADEMDQRREDLLLRWEDVAEKARISTTYLRKFRRGDVTASGVVIASLEDALRWQRGSIQAIRDGGRPVPLVDSPDRNKGKTLGELLLQRGLRRPEELGLSDEIRDDPVALEIIDADEFSEDTKDAMLSAYATMRRQVFEAVLHEKRRPRE